MPAGGNGDGVVEPGLRGGRGKGVSLKALRVGAGGIIITVPKVVAEGRADGAVVFDAERFLFRSAFFEASSSSSPYKSI